MLSGASNVREALEMAYDARFSMLLVHEIQHNLVDKWFICDISVQILILDSKVYGVMRTLLEEYNFCFDCCIISASHYSTSYN